MSDRPRLGVQTLTQPRQLRDALSGTHGAPRRLAGHPDSPDQAVLGELDVLDAAAPERAERRAAPGVERELRGVEQGERRLRDDAAGDQPGGGERQEAVLAVAAANLEAER